MSTSSAARIGFVEEACICMGTKYHVACPIDCAVIWIGSNIVEEEVHCLFCGNGGLGLAGGDGAESNELFVIDHPCMVEKGPAISCTRHSRLASRSSEESGSGVT